MKDFQLGIRYERPPTEPASWFHETLHEVRQQRVGNVPVRIDILGGGSVDGLLDGVGDAPLASHGVISIDTGATDETITAIPCEDIDAFTLVGDVPIEQGDEVRG